MLIGYFRPSIVTKYIGVCFPALTYITCSIWKNFFFLVIGVILVLTWYQISSVEVINSIYTQFENAEASYIYYFLSWKICWESTQPENMCGIFFEKGLRSWSYSKQSEWLSRCSHSKSVLRNFPKFIRKDLCLSLFMIKLDAADLHLHLKRDSITRYFLWILRNL